MDENKREEIALFRYGIILPFLSQDEMEWGVKGEMLRRLETKDYDIPHSEKHSVDQETIRKWLYSYQEKGFDGLKPKDRSDIGKIRSIDPEAWEMAVKLKKEAPGRRVAKIIRIMEANGLIEPGEIKRSTLSRHFKEQGLDRKTLTKSNVIHRRFETDRPNQLWQSDILYGPYLPDPKNPERKKRTYLAAFIDDHSRLVPHGEFYWDEKYPALEYTLKKAILKRGIPECFYVDNGKVYSTRKLDAICAALGIRKLHCKPYSPEGKGKIERFFRTVRDDLLVEPEIANIQTLDELNKLFWAWLEVDYHQREHTSTKQSPLERWRENIGKFLRTIDEKELVEIFLYQVSRTVNKVGIVSVSGIEFEVDALLKQKKVQVRYNPFDLSWVNIYYNGQFIQKVKPFTLKRWNTKDKSKTLTAEEKISTGIKPLQQLVGQHHEQKKQHAAHLTGQTVNKDEPLTAAKFIHHLGATLGKKPEDFHAMEIENLKDFLQQYPQITTECIALAVGKIIITQGSKQHISVYLQAIKNLYFKWEKEK